MNYNDTELTILSSEEARRDRLNDKCIEVLRKYGICAAITDLAILTGAQCDKKEINTAPDDYSLKGRTGSFYTRTARDLWCVKEVGSHGTSDWFLHYARLSVIRPVLKSPSVFSQVYQNRVKGYNGTEEVEYGEYPQYVPDSEMQKILESEYQRGNLKATCRDYTFDKTKNTGYNQSFQPVIYKEYEYNNKKYIRVKANTSAKNMESFYNYYKLQPPKDYEKFQLSNGEYYIDGDYVWVEVSPVVWLIDEKTQTLVSKRGLLSGIRFHAKEPYYNEDFSITELKQYLDKYMLHDLTQSETLAYNQEMSIKEKDKVKKRKR